MTDADPYENTPTAMVFDVFSETANDLIAIYVHRSDTAVDPEAREGWWQRALAVRSTRRAVEPYDRQALLRQIASWKQEIEMLKADR
ncbi:hypothetical protein [Streptomyces sp. NPDC089915]|uniref:hypothetical protein n=1 Tax=Streptomyces sp. NPDC089915 TaxID=3155186 RepID=UPI00343BA5BC